MEALLGEQSSDLKDRKKLELRVTRESPKNSTPARGCSALGSNPSSTTLCEQQFSN